MQDVKKGKKRRRKKEKTKGQIKTKARIRRSCASAIGIATNIRAGLPTDCLSIPGLDKKPVLETTQPPVEWRAATSCSVIKRPKLEANQSRSPFSEDKNERT
jgi:hypothetical protein